MVDVMPDINTLLSITGLCSCMSARLLYFPTPPCILFCSRAYFRMKEVVLNMLRTHLNFNKGLALPIWEQLPHLSFWCNGLFLRENISLCIELIHLRTPCKPKRSRRCKHTPDTLWLTLCCLHTVERVDELQQNKKQKNNSPPSSLFMFCTKPPQPNYEAPQLLCVCWWEDLLSTSSTYHELHFWEAQSADRWKIKNILQCRFKHRQIMKVLRKPFVGYFHFSQYSIVTTHIPYIFMCSVQMQIPKGILYF